MAGKHDINVKFAFTADTSQVQKELKELEQSLKLVNKAAASKDVSFNDEKILKASQAATELERHLKAAVNVNTGNLDLSRFSTSLKASGKNLEDYYTLLSQGGAEGQQAFLNLAKSISSAEAPTIRINKYMEGFLDTLKKTAKWQISSSIYRGLVGTIQHAYNYAQDLNESLNNIRIVTGQSTDQMAKFAQKANDAARALSTTTTNYTDAALIFYQQGSLKIT